MWCPSLISDICFPFDAFRVWPFSLVYLPHFVLTTTLWCRLESNWLQNIQWESRLSRSLWSLCLCVLRVHCWFQVFLEATHSNSTPVSLRVLCAVPRSTTRAQGVQMESILPSMEWPSVDKLEVGNRRGTHARGALRQRGSVLFISRQDSTHWIKRDEPCSLPL